MASISTSVVSTLPLKVYLKQQGESSCKSRLTEDHLWDCMMVNVLLDIQYMQYKTWGNFTAAPSIGNTFLKTNLMALRHSGT